MMQKTHTQFVLDFSEKGDSNIELLEEYVKTKQKILVKCKKCNHSWYAWPDVLLSGAGCRYCKGMHKLTTNEFSQRLKAINPNIQVIGEYQTTHKHITVKCLVCNHEWTSMPSNLLRNYGCPICKGGIQHTKDYFEQRMHEYHPDIEFLGTYHNSLTKIKLRCKRCGKVWETAPNSLLNGKRSSCPACAHNQTSYIEQVILSTCKSVFGENHVISRARNIIGTELDIVITNYSEEPIIAIEPGSWSLHKNKVQLDIKKIAECKEKNIDLLIIYDSCKNEHIVNTENIWTYSKSFSRSNDKEICSLLERIANRFDFKLTNLDFNSIKKIAYNNSRRISTEEFKKQIAKINPSIEILGEYNGNERKILTKCLICGYKWETSPAVLKMKCGCPKCKKRPHKDTNYFIDEIKEINTNISILGEYVNAKTKILTRCNICGNEWLAIPDKLRIGRGCPKCARKHKPKQNAILNDEA